MSRLSDDSLEFAKKHIESYYDSDFFPKNREYDAIWHSWEDVKKELSSTNVTKLPAASAITATSVKPKGGFRIVQQLDAVSTIVYTALAYEVADSIERNRVPIELNVACSYRIDLNNGSFFADGNGFNNYVNKSKELADAYKYVLYTDITDFYNQIYLHRLNNAIEFSNSSLSNESNDIEAFLSKLNGKNSQGIPVGPAASIIMAEAILMDIDDYIINEGLSHTRYVDDFRIFSNSKDELLSILEKLTLYLYKNHRLTLSSDKTKIIDCEIYVDEILFNHYEIEKIKILRKIEVYNPYSNELEESSEQVIDEAESFQEQIRLVSAQIFQGEYLDIGIARFFLRKSKRFKLKQSAKIIFENFEHFLPVVNDVFLYLDKVSDEEFIAEWLDAIINLSNSEVMNRNLVKIWFEWYVSKNVYLVNNQTLKKKVFSNFSITNQSQAAIVLNNLSWIRSKKSDLSDVNNRDRLVILRAASILAKDEKDNWLRLVEQNSQTSIEKWVAKWVREV